MSESVSAVLEDETLPTLMGWQFKLRGILTCTDTLDRNRLCALCSWCGDLLRLVESGLEQSVDECRLAESGFT